jgi:hypothetical protein
MGPVGAGTLRLLETWMDRYVGGGHDGDRH